MAVNHYFNNYGAKYTDQRIVEDLIVESIKIMGFEAYYLPNVNDAARDLLYGEDPLRKFTTAFQLEFYLSNALEYSGERELFSKFGLEIKNNASIIVSKRSFTQRVPQNTFTRPREGDLIYVPFLNGTGELFEIKFVNQTKDFFMLGRQVPYFYELEIEKFKYSQEIIETGLPDIDVVVTDSAYTQNFNMQCNSAEDYIAKEIVFQSEDSTLANASCSAVVSSWNSITLVLSVTNIKGEFVDGQNVIGATSGAVHTLNNYDPLENPAEKEAYDNKILETESDEYLDTSESNPLGNLGS